jgi:hypothetical protein
MSETTTEWAVIWHEMGESDVSEVCADEAAARRLARMFGELDADVVTRTVTRGPWQPAPTTP